MMLTGGALAFWLIILPLAGAIFIGYLLYKLLGDRGSANMREEEARIIQDIHQNLSKLERRVESLEVLLADQEKYNERQ